MMARSLFDDICPLCQTKMELEDYRHDQIIYHCWGCGELVTRRGNHISYQHIDKDVEAQLDFEIEDG